MRYLQEVSEEQTRPQMRGCSGTHCHSRKMSYKDTEVS